jgi:hypothetical protein
MNRRVALARLQTAPLSRYAGAWPACDALFPSARHASLHPDTAVQGHLPPRGSAGCDMGARRALLNQPAEA